MSNCPPTCMAISSWPISSRCRFICCLHQTRRQGGPKWPTAQGPQNQGAPIEEKIRVTALQLSRTSSSIDGSTLFCATKLLRSPAPVASLAHGRARRFSPIFSMLRCNESMTASLLQTAASGRSPLHQPHPLAAARWCHCTVPGSAPRPPQPSCCCLRASRTWQHLQSRETINHSARCLGH